MDNIVILQLRTSHCSDSGENPKVKLKPWVQIRFVAGSGGEQVGGLAEDMGGWLVKREEIKLKQNSFVYKVNWIFY